MCVVKRNLKWGTVIYQAMCLLSSDIMKTGTVIYPVRQTDGRKALFCSSFAWKLRSCQILSLPQCAVKLQINRTEDYFGLSAQVSSCTDFKVSSCNLELLQQRNSRAEADELISSPLHSEALVLQCRELVCGVVCAARLVHINCVHEPVKVASLPSSAHDPSQSPRGWIVCQTEENTLARAHTHTHTHTPRTEKVCARVWGGGLRVGVCINRALLSSAWSVRPGWDPEPSDLSW